MSEEKMGAAAGARTRTEQGTVVELSNCLDCNTPFPKGKGFRNVCTPKDEFPFCSRACAERRYWSTDQPAALKEIMA